MGVRGLQYFVERGCDDICVPVNVRDMAEHHRRSLPSDQRPVIAVDGMCLIRKVYADSLDGVYGGQWIEFVALLRDFVRCFDAAGIRLVFFFDGPVCPEKRQEWVGRRIRKGKEIEELFLTLRRTGRLPPDEKDFHPPASIGTLTRFALKFGCSCEVITTKKEADFEVADYARREPSVFAILAQDTDFLIYDTKPYLSVTHLDLGSLSTLLYDRQRLVAKLSLSVDHLPLFSCLLGNDVIPVEILKPFHRKLCFSYGHRSTAITELAPLVSQLIVRNRWNGDFRDSRELSEICKEVFGVQRNMELLRDGLMFYFLYPVHGLAPDQGFPAIADQRHVSSENFPSIYGLLRSMEYESSEVLEDCRDSSLPPTNTAFRPLRQRAYSILFDRHLKQGRSVEVKEWCHVAGRDLYKPDIVLPLPIGINGGVPSLETLWCSLSPDVQDTRIRCFCACLGGALQPKHVLSVPPKYAALCCIINYLLAYGRERRPLLAPWEVSAFIAQAVCPRANDLNWLNSVQIPSVDTRAVQLASLFMRGIVTLGLVLGTCGYPFPITDIMPWNFFNGKLFHAMYIRAKKGATVEDLCEHRAEVLEEFYNLLSVITHGTTLCSPKLFGF